MKRIALLLTPALLLSSCGIKVVPKESSSIPDISDISEREDSEEEVSSQNSEGSEEKDASSNEENTPYKELRDALDDLSCASDSLIENDVVKLVSTISEDSDLIFHSRESQIHQEESKDYVSSIGVNALSELYTGFAKDNKRNNIDIASGRLEGYADLDIDLPCLSQEGIASERRFYSDHEFFGLDYYLYDDTFYYLANPQSEVLTSVLEFIGERLSLPYLEHFGSPKKITLSMLNSTFSGGITRLLALSFFILPNLFDLDGAEPYCELLSHNFTYSQGEEENIFHIELALDDLLDVLTLNAVELGSFQPLATFIYGSGFLLEADFSFFEDELYSFSFSLNKEIGPLSKGALALSQLFLAPYIDKVSLGSSLKLYTQFDYSKDNEVSPVPDLDYYEIGEF